MDDQLVAAAVLAGPDAVIAADRAGVIRYWNAGAERIFGFSAAEALDSSLDIIIPERLQQRHWSGWHDFVQTGQSRYGPDDLLSVPGRRRDGRPLSIEFTIHPILDDRGALEGVAATLRDVTARFAELRDLRRRLSSATSPTDP